MLLEARQVIDRACEQYGDAAVEKLSEQAGKAAEADSYYAAAVQYLAASNLACYMSREQNRSDFARALDEYCTKEDVALDSVEPQIMSSLVGTAVDHAEANIITCAALFDLEAFETFKEHVPYFDESNPLDTVVPDSEVFGTR